MAPEFLKHCWCCKQNLSKEEFTESRWESESETSLCASCACDLEKNRYDNNKNYRESKKKKAKESYNKEEARVKKAIYRQKVKDNKGKKLRG